MGKGINTFNIFAGKGNTGEIEMDWQCSTCKKDLDFRLIIYDSDNIEWEAQCCQTIYTITPYVGAYNQRDSGLV